MGSEGKVKKKEENAGEKIIKNITSNYRQLEESIVSQLGLCNDLHPTTTGTLREDIWLQLFEVIVPKKFVIEHSIFIIDSYGHVSKEVDLALIDNTYTPYIFQYGRLKYVPIEAVAAVIECKSKSVSFHKCGSEKASIELEEAKKAESEKGMTAWCNSIESLRTSRESIVRMATGAVVFGVSYNYDKNEGSLKSAQTSTRPIRIFCGYKTEISKKNREKISDFFDFVLLACEEGGVKKIEIDLKDKGTLQDWYISLDHYQFEVKKSKNIEKEDDTVINNKHLNDHYLKDLKVEQKDEETSLLSFNFQLNQLLMLINNPILFPHFGYASMFRGEQREIDC